MQYRNERSPINSEIMIALKRIAGIESGPANKLPMTKPKGKAIPNPTAITQKIDALLPVTISLTENFPATP